MPQTIGIIGGGQLGRMLSEAAIRLGFEVCVIDPTPDCPAKQVGADQIVADYKDKQAILRLAEKADYITIEFEHIDTSALEQAEKKKPVNPSPSTIRLIQDKYHQKKFLQENNFPTADFAEIIDLEQAEQLFDGWGGMLIKSKKEAFDGRGNILVRDKFEIKKALSKFSGKGLYGEKLINFRMELAVMAGRDMRGEIITYPVVQTVHERNICTEVFAPADVSPALAHKARDIAKEVVSRLEGAGMYGVEMFLEGEDILINEIAPRVHNSGHYSMNLCDVSQFEQHILAISGQELKKPVLKAPACCMVNILGERDGPVELAGLAEALTIPRTSVYIYGKKPTKIDRKMGHINAIGATMEEAKKNAEKARNLISI